MRAVQDHETAQGGESESVDLAAVGRRQVIPGSDITADANDLISSLPWWASRGLLYVVGGFIFCTIIWASCARMDDVAVARGSIVPEGEVRPLQALEAGTVSTVNVHEGDVVAKGQTLVQLDDTVLQAKEKQARLEYEGAQVNLISLRDSGADVNAIVDAEARATELKNNLDGAELALQRARLTAPTAGTITALTVHGAGAVVREGDVVASIAPAGARLVAEVMIPNEHIAKVHPGLPVRILVDAYPYQQYGVFDGIVLTVSPDAIASPTGESFYRAVVVPDKTTLSSGVSLKPGLALEARIVTDHRTVMGLFLDPFRHASLETHGSLAMNSMQSSGDGS
jgi:multidrug efflux pump subunit AcrA (membrane-fusion protein)